MERAGATRQAHRVSCTGEEVGVIRAYDPGRLPLQNRAISTLPQRDIFSLEVISLSRGRGRLSFLSRYCVHQESERFFETLLADFFALVVPEANHDEIV